MQVKDFPLALHLTSGIVIRYLYFNLVDTDVCLCCHIQANHDDLIALRVIASKAFNLA